MPRLAGIVKAFSLALVACACALGGPLYDVAQGARSFVADPKVGSTVVQLETSWSTSNGDRLVVRNHGQEIFSITLVGLDRASDRIDFDISVGRKGLLQEWTGRLPSSKAMLTDRPLVSDELAFLSSDKGGVSTSLFHGYFIVKNHSCDLWFYLRADTLASWSLRQSGPGKYRLARVIDESLRSAICAMNHEATPGARPVLASEDFALYFSSTDGSGVFRLPFPWPSLDPMNYPCRQVGQETPASKK